MAKAYHFSVAVDGANLYDKMLVIHIPNYGIFVQIHDTNVLFFTFRPPPLNFSLNLVDLGITKK